jgi:hypothetical protein
MEIPKIAVAALREVAQRIGLVLSGRVRSDSVRGSWHSRHRSARPVLGETFQVWTLGNSAFHSLERSMLGVTADQRLVEFTENTRYWHHQIRVYGGKAVGFAESLRILDSDGVEHLELHSVALSRVASAIDGGIKRIDSIVGADAVRLITIPALPLDALWLDGRKSDRVVVVRKPRGGVGLATGRVYDGHAFLRALSKYLMSRPKVGPSHGGLSVAMQRGASLPSAAVRIPSG